MAEEWPVGDIRSICKVVQKKAESVGSDIFRPWGDSEREVSWERFSSLPAGICVSKGCNVHSGIKVSEAICRFYKWSVVSRNDYFTGFEDLGE